MNVHSCVVASFLVLGSINEGSFSYSPPFISLGGACKFYFGRFHRIAMLVGMNGLFMFKIFVGTPQSSTNAPPSI
jgi:hypothetical protein